MLRSYYVFMKSIIGIVMTASMRLQGSIGSGPPSSLVPQPQQPHYLIRPFRVADHQADLERICRHVYGGRDYLPQTSQSLVDDALSEFVVLMKQTERDNTAVVAVANARRLQVDHLLWLEAVRTCANHRGQGLATLLARHVAAKAQQDGLRLVSCTVQSNAAMIKVFDRIGMIPLGTIHQLDFGELLKLDGWSAHSDDDSNHHQQHSAAQPLLQALGLDDAAVSPVCRDQEAVWIPVESLSELQQVLETIRRHGGLGHMPGLYELLSKQQLDDCLFHQRIWKTPRESAVLALYQDDKIQSLASPWVCSVAAVTAHDVETAVRFACQRSSAFPFTLSIDGAVSVRDCKVLEALPFVKDPCLLYAARAGSR